MKNFTEHFSISLILLALFKVISLALMPLFASEVGAAGYAAYSLVVAGSSAACLVIGLGTDQGLWRVMSMAKEPGGSAQTALRFQSGILMVAAACSICLGILTVYAVIDFNALAIALTTLIFSVVLYASNVMYFFFRSISSL